MLLGAGPTSLAEGLGALKIATRCPALLTGFLVHGKDRLVRSPRGPFDTAPVLIIFGISESFPDRSSCLEAPRKGRLSGRVLS